MKTRMTMKQHYGIILVAAIIMLIVGYVIGCKADDYLRTKNGIAYREDCIDGVKYICAGYSLTIKFNRDGMVELCDEGSN